MSARLLALYDLTTSRLHLICKDLRYSKGAINGTRLVFIIKRTVDNYLRYILDEVTSGDRK